LYEGGIVISLQTIISCSAAEISKGRGVGGIRKFAVHPDLEKVQVKNDFFPLEKHIPQSYGPKMIMRIGS
jgi:hypothetical protein